MALVRYTLLRVLVFAVVAALLWLIGFRGYLLLLAAVFISGIFSLFVLRRSRDVVSEALDRRISAIKERTAAEDAWDDARRARIDDAQTVDHSDPGTEDYGDPRAEDDHDPGSERRGEGRAAQRSVPDHGNGPRDTGSFS